MCPLSSTFKRPYSPIQFGQEENIPGHSTERRAYWFILKIARLFLIPSSRNRTINTFIIVNFTFSPLEKDLPSPFSLARNRIYLGTHLKEELTNSFWKLKGYSLFPHRQSRKECEHFANMVNIITLCKR